MSESEERWAWATVDGNLSFSFVERDNFRAAIAIGDVPRDRAALKKCVSRLHECMLEDVKARIMGQPVPPTAGHCSARLFSTSHFVPSAPVTSLCPFRTRA